MLSRLFLIRRINELKKEKNSNEKVLKSLNLEQPYEWAALDNIVWSMSNHALLRE